MMLRSRRALPTVFTLIAAGLVAGCSDGDRPDVLADVVTVPTVVVGTQSNQNISNPTLQQPETFPVKPGDTLTLVWSDEFDGAALDPETWFFATGDGSEVGLPGGWGNNELQYYLPDNAQLEGGILKITAKRESIGGLNYTSARLNTEDRFAFQYGRIEGRIKLPSGQGLWPAFWMLSQDSTYQCNGQPCVWAAIGEMDVVEAINLDGTGDNEIFATIHYGGEFPANESSSVTYDPGPDVTDDFHVYAMEWDEFEIRWYFDDVLYAVQNNWFSTAAPYPAPFNQPFHILLNLAVGGNFPGNAIDSAIFPAVMEVDWIRVYSGEDDFVPANPGTVPDDVIYASDQNETVDIVFGVDYSGFEPFGSGSTFDNNVTTDRDFNPAFGITTGNGYGAQVGQFALVGFDAGFATGYATLDFKAKGLNNDLIRVRFLDAGNYIDVDLTSSGYSTDLGNGWYQVSIPIVDFSGVDTATGLLFETDNTAADSFTFLLTDFGFSGMADDGSITPDNVVYATDPNVTEDLAPAGVDNFGSGAVFDFNFAGDARFNPAIQAVSGEGYGADVHVAFVAFTGYAAGFASTFENFVFKVKADAVNLGSFEVKFIGNGDTSVLYDIPNYSGTQDIGDGWLQVTIPMSDFAANIAMNDGFLLGPAGAQPAAYSYLMTDIGFTGTSGGGGGSGGGGTGMFTNGDFETGDFTGWTQGAAGTYTVESDTLDGRTGLFGRLRTTDAPQDVLLSQVALGAGSIAAGDSIDVSFDLYGTLTGDSGVVFVEVIFLDAMGQDVGGRDFVGPAAPYSPTTTWTNYSGTVAAGTGATGSQFDVSGGVTLQLKAACGGVPGCAVDAYFDNVTFTVTGN